nr:transport and Golgi organization protein 2 homolog isoform X2 [Nomia melanderi]XP_031836628.1 transport and Golgi organization protein 2 homolog isoform X2 [Nomia melanderi]XP_031836629.1 transport and Golgi organization protein 2 homolog isoform X2 [Nomia melanderi]
MEPGKEGGTWLALSLKGKAGIILNLPNEETSYDTPKKGRGHLITNFITSNDSAVSYLNKLHKENQNGQPYNPYLLVLIDLYNANVNCLSSSIKSKGPFTNHDAVLGCSNSDFDSPLKKVEGGKEKFRSILKNIATLKEADLIEELLKLLKSEERYLPDPVLQQRHSPMYEKLSSIFISGKEYCTRTHSILLVNGNNEIVFVEDTLMPDLTWKCQIFNNNLICENK